MELNALKYIESHFGNGKFSIVINIFNNDFPPVAYISLIQYIFLSLSPRLENSFDANKTIQKVMMKGIDKIGKPYFPSTPLKLTESTSVKSEAIINRK